jgi:hypothetical protein
MKLAGAIARIFARNAPSPETTIGAAVGWPRRSQGWAAAIFISRGKRQRCALGNSA